MSLRHYWTIEDMLVYFVNDQHASDCFKFIKKNQKLFNSSKGSATKHQAWSGGYRAHIAEVMNIAVVTFEALEHIRPLPFSLSDALLGCFLHDIEKIWKHAIDYDDQEIVDKNKILNDEFHLTDDLWNAIKYTHGEGDDYHPTERIQKPLAAFVHHCDNTSARIWFDQPRLERYT